jgi:flagellar protein FlgJ
MALDLPPMNPALLQAATPVASKDLKMQQIEESAKDFEAMFMSEMLKPIFESVEVNETFGGGKGEEIFRGFIRDEYAKNYAATGGIGIAALVKEQLIQMQAKAENAQLAQNVQGITGSITTGESDVQ